MDINYTAKPADKFAYPSDQPCQISKTAVEVRKIYRRLRS